MFFCQEFKGFFCQVEINNFHFWTLYTTQKRVLAKPAVIYIFSVFMSDTHLTELTEKLHQQSSPPFGGSAFGPSLAVNDYRFSPTKKMREMDLNRTLRNPGSQMKSGAYER